MIGGLWIAPEGSLPKGAWLIGTGVIILGMTWIRHFNGLAVSGFWIFMGILVLGSGLSSVFGLNIPVFPILLIIIGLSVILKPFLLLEKKWTKPKKSKLRTLLYTMED